MQTQVEIVDAVPSKRLFLSIIADYNLNRAICELIDNALDIWVGDEKKGAVQVDVELETTQQIVRVTDNMGGVKREDFKLIVGPGQTGNDPEEEQIGIFGVGTKRAVVALSQDITITSRRHKDKTYRVEINDEWLKNDEWNLPLYLVPDISPGTTFIQCKQLRMQIDNDVVDRLRDHLGITYAKFLKNKNVTIALQGTPISGMTFENWAFPPKYPPHSYIGELQSADGGKVNVEVLGGLTLESSPAGEYGVYVYCNDRLIAKELKSYDVGFKTGLVGLPHPAISLALTGPANLMPWNSSKSDIYPDHNTFVALRDFIIKTVKEYTAISRAWNGQWTQEVFGYDSGEIKQFEIDDFPEAKKSYLAPHPISKPRYGDLVSQANRAIASSKPWTTGLYEGVVATDLIFNKNKLTQKNRISLILLDSTLEIGFKDFLVHESGHHYSDSLRWTRFFRQVAK